MNQAYKKECCVFDQNHIGVCIRFVQLQLQCIRKHWAHFEVEGGTANKFEW